MSKRVFFTFIYLLLILVNVAIGDTTYVSGIINTNTVWTPAGSPYVVIGNVLVNTNVRLDIQPGVEVLFTQDKYLMIKGTLHAIGTEEDSIIFTALDTTQRWQRLWFKPEANGCSLKYCQISYACSSAIYNEDTIYIGYSKITSNYANYGGGICNGYYGTATITNNTITNNTAYDGGGIYNYGTATITYNTIIDSTYKTIFINSSSITINYNNLNNLNPNGYTVYNNTADTINARYNYWYTLDTNLINQKIYDFWDDFTLGEVFYRPFLTGPIGIEEKEELSKDLKTIYANLSNLPKENLKIYNILGKIVNPKNLKPGIYFMETKEKRKVIIVK